MLVTQRLKSVFATKALINRLGFSNTQCTRGISSESQDRPITSSSPPTFLRACLFIELAALAEAVDTYALETHGPRYTSRFALDLSALVPSLQAQTKERICGGRPVQIVRTFVYGVSASSSPSNNESSNGVSSSHPQSALDRSRFNTFRACTNEGYAMRVFHSKSDPHGLAGFAAAVALSADVVHACAPPPPSPPALQISNIGNINGDQPSILSSGGGDQSSLSLNSSLDSTVPSGSGYDIVVGLVGGSAFLPPLIRAAQHGKGVLMATRFTSDFSAAWRDRPTVFKSLIDAIPLESITPKLIVPFNDFRQGASLDVGALVEKLSVYFASRFGTEASVTGSALGKAAAAAGIAKDLSRHRLSIRALVGRAPHVFVVTEEPGGANTNYTVRLVKQKKASSSPVIQLPLTADISSDKGVESHESLSVTVNSNNRIIDSSTSTTSLLSETIIQESNAVQISTSNNTSISIESQENIITSGETDSPTSLTEMSTSTAVLASNTSSKTPRKKKTATIPTLLFPGLDELYASAVACNLVTAVKDVNSKAALLSLIEVTLPSLKHPKSSATKAELVSILQSNLEEVKDTIVRGRVE
jgi:hypothetical protein